jgi:hypothetical protein
MAVFPFSSQHSHLSIECYLAVSEDLGGSDTPFLCDLEASELTYLTQVLLRPE